tara:strand:- start:45550 stop:45822 length:273 start_codon:yes stop_codon:yes gene_type:complete
MRTLKFEQKYEIIEMFKKLDSGMFTKVELVNRVDKILGYKVSQTTVTSLAKLAGLKIARPPVVKTIHYPRDISPGNVCRLMIVLLKLLRR